MLSAAKDRRSGEKASGAIGSYPSQHDADHGEIDPGFFAAGEQLVVLPQTPAGAEPGKGAFHHPAPRQDLEAAGPARRRLLGAVWRGPDAALAAPGVGHNLDLAAPLGLDPVGEAAALIAGFPPDPPH